MDNPEKRTPGTKRKLSFLGFGKRYSVDGHGTETGPELDEEMEKVFAMDTGEKFNVSRLGSPSESAGSDRERGAPPRYGEQDFNQHRKRSYPHPHMPLKSLHSRSMRRHLSPEGSTSEPGTEDEQPTTESNGNGEAHEEIDAFSNGGAIQTTGTDVAYGDGESDHAIDGEAIRGNESEAPISERAASGYNESPVLGSPRVQFEKIREEGAASPPPEIPPVEEDRKTRRHHKHDHKRHHHKSRKYSLQEDPQWRKRSGAGITDGNNPFARRVSVQPDEASTLQELDIDGLESHRSDDPRGMRRHKAGHSTVHIGRKMEGGIPHDTFKKMYDHSPHEVFVQLDELHGIGEEREWRETARWIKYEEDVEEGADRWGRPHVASLSFHSLLNLRRCLETGVVLLDLEERDLPGVAYRVVEQMVVEELILADDRPVVMRALLLRHRHVNEHERFRFGGKRNYASYTSLQSIWLEEEEAAQEATENHVNQHNLTDSKPKIVSSTLALDKNHTTVDIKEELTYTSSHENLKQGHNDYILKRIPAGAEATTVLVGAVDFLDQPTIAFVRLAEGVFMPSLTEVTIPVRFMFILLGPRNANLDYHEVGRSISTLMANTSFHKIAYKANERRELLSAINEFLDDSIVLPPGDWERQALLPFDELKAKSEAIKRRKAKALEKKAKPTQSDAAAKKALLAGEDEKKPPFDDPLIRTRRPFGGLINDIKRRYPYYLSDFTDGLTSTCLAAAMFMYFAALCTAITFGGLLSDKTDNLIGISETLISAAGAGVIVALFATQPLVIIGTTGPLLLFDESLYKFCLANDLEFLTLRVYVGVWIGVIALVIACVDGSVLVKLFTRFSEEIFTGLISLLYIVETIMKMAKCFERHPLFPAYCFAPNENLTISNYNNTELLTNESFNDSANLSVPLQCTLDYLPDHDAVGLINQPNTALMCTILILGTFLGAYYLRIFRNSHYLGRSARRAFGDFGVPISIIVFVLIDFLAGVKTDKLLVPAGLTPSAPEKRVWFISPGGINKSVPIWVALACAVPAFLVYILIFMETQISELIIDKKERKLRKGNGYHLDIVIISLMNVGCGFVGMPWCCAASVRSLTHVSSLTVMSTNHAPGDKPHIVEVKEQRVSGLLVSILVGLSILMAPLLRRVPLAVLLGVFLYMGISSTNGVQLFDRVKLFFMPVKHHGTANYVRRVQTYKMHIFTLIQISCLAVLWIVKSTPASLAFPFFLLLMLPLRSQMTRFFTPAELRALDTKEPDNEGTEDEPDFYEEAPLPG
ncbi:band 3 anion transport protein isoform X2 [Athalia rosae]|uniref:band 3 anion transport protein isoform X2 n=1 Tax=Athalia rosae TaxID=37344 RepID=UPI0020342FB0|nr:band 3 anion transport protein isoform X2 [Athalia rosae]